MTTTIPTLEDLQLAKDGSYYTITGTGDDLSEWVEGYQQWLTEEGIGTPVQWFQTTGAAVNYFAQPSDPKSELPSDLVLLLFPLDGLDIGRLAIFKIQRQDRWFDDVVTNMARGA